MFIQETKNDKQNATEMASGNISSGISSTSSSATEAVNSCSPSFEDTSGLDVFAQIAASAHPLPVEQVRRDSITTSSIVQQSQSQLAQSIYQSQQALRLKHQHQHQHQQQHNNNKDYKDYNHPHQQQHQKQNRESNESNVRSFKPEIDGDLDLDDEDDFDSDSDKFDTKSSNSNNRNRNRSVFENTIKEESESDLQMDTDQSINYYQRQRSPSLSLSNDLSSTQMLTRRLSAPDNSSNFSTSSGLTTRRVIHNICERKRRENIRDGFFQLQNRLPPHISNNPRLSKMDILAGATNLINDIKGRISNLSAEISALSQVSVQIEKKNHSMES